MPDRVVIYPWKMASQGCKLLAEGIGVRRVKPDGIFKPRKGDIIINWGNGSVNGTPIWNDLLNESQTVLNKFENVDIATDKRKAFEAMEKAGVPIPEWTTSRTVAASWLEEECLVCVRDKIYGHGAEGLSVISMVYEDNISALDQTPKASLYTKYVKKRDEFRVHVAGNKIIDVAQKKLHHEFKDQKPSYQIRNHKGGWIYARTGVNPHPSVLKAAVDAVKALGLDFGAVDIGWNAHYKQPTVYEVNTAPGLTGTTLYKYAKYFSEKFNRKLNIEKPDHDFDHINDFPLDDYEAA